jgi:hypothetical protein
MDVQTTATAAGARAAGFSKQQEQIAVSSSRFAPSITKGEQ